MVNKTKVKVQLAGWGGKQMRLTIPKSIAKAMNLEKGDDVRWLIVQGEVIVRKI